MEVAKSLEFDNAAFGVIRKSVEVIDGDAEVNDESLEVTNESVEVIYESVEYNKSILNGGEV